MRAMLDAIAANGLLALTDAVISGYFVTPEQVKLAGETIDRVRSAHPFVKVVVDPVLGDTGRGFFVPGEVCEAVRDRAGPARGPGHAQPVRAGVPGRAAADGVAEVVAAARGLGRPALVTSAPGGEGEIGVLYVDPATAVLAAHRRLERAPGDGRPDLRALRRGPDRGPGAGRGARAGDAGHGGGGRGGRRAGGPRSCPSWRLGERLVRPDGGGCVSGEPRVIHDSPFCQKEGLAMAEITGLAPPRFARVKDAFAALFDQGLELGAQFAVAVDGEVVLDL